MELWNKDIEKEFFKNSLKVSSADKLFYQTDDNRYLAYYPKKYKGSATTLQSRNAFIGDYTEKFCKELFSSYAKERDLYVMQSVICDEIGLTNRSPADIVISRKKGKEQKAEDIVALFEVKMSIVWNWEYKNENKIECIGDYTSHKGNPGLLRSDSMLKAIGKSINVRVNGFSATHIPIIVLGNTPITESYEHKVDYLKKSGVIQGFWSVNPRPGDNKNYITITPENGFFTFEDLKQLEQKVDAMLKGDYEFFSSMITKKELGSIIKISAQETEFESMAQKFLELIRQ